MKARPQPNAPTFTLAPGQSRDERAAALWNLANPPPIDVAKRVGKDTRRPA